MELEQDHHADDRRCRRGMWHGMVASSYNSTLVYYFCSNFQQKQQWKEISFSFLAKIKAGKRKKCIYIPVCWIYILLVLFTFLLTISFKKKFYFCFADTIRPPLEHKISPPLLLLYLIHLHKICTLKWNLKQVGHIFCLALERCLPPQKGDM